MMGADYKLLNYGKYKDMGRNITKVCDFVELFTAVNSKILNEDKEKLGSGKRRSSKITNIFREATEALIKIERMIKEIRVIPIKVSFTQ